MAGRHKIIPLPVNANDAALEVLGAVEWAISEGYDGDMIYQGTGNEPDGFRVTFSNGRAFLFTAWEVPAGS